MAGKKGRRWTAGELSLLRRLAYRAPLSTIAGALDRDVVAVRTKAAHERLPLQDDLRRPDPCPQSVSPRQARSVTMVDGRIEPQPGDYVVLYEVRTPQGNPRLALVCVAREGEPTLIRATFSSAEEAGPRFEEQARRMASAIGTRAFRCVDGRYTLLDSVTAESARYDRGRSALA